jgi:peptidoglycan/LPS O-acetylase OafA/YrhL
MLLDLADMAQVRRLPVATSLYLDVIRFAAAVMVACGHLTQKYFSTGWQDHTTLAVNAVAIFFVLSGFVIRYTTRLKYHRIGEYWVDRAARIYSVVLPAVGFTIVADAIAYKMNPGYYLGNWYENIDHPGLRLLTNLTFTSQVWSKSIALFSNGPFWSLSYECFYYVLYGCAFYLTGWRRWVSILLVAGLAGPHILFLLPLWILGCVLFDLYEWLRGSKFAKLKLNVCFLVVGVAGWLVRDAAFQVVFALKTKLAQLFLAHHHQPINLRWTLDYYSVGIPAGYLLLWSVTAMKSLRDPQPSLVGRSIREMAEGTFPLYLFHFPCFVLIAAVFPYNHASDLKKILILLVVLGFGVSLAKPTNQLKNLLRGWMRRQFIPTDALPQARDVEAF